MHEPNRRLRVVVVADDPTTCQFYREALSRLGHQVVGVAHSGKSLAEECRALRPDLVIADVRMPEQDGIAAAEEICRDRPVPVILATAYHDPTLLARLPAEAIYGYLVKPFPQEALAPAIAVALRQFGRCEALRREAADLRQALEDRKVIERAKGILMKRAGVDEAEAFRRLQSLATDQNRKLVEVAQVILTAEEAFSPPSPPPSGDGDGHRRGRGRPGGKEPFAPGSWVTGHKAAAKPTGPRTGRGGA
jgi:response regulator NasT